MAELETLHLELESLLYAKNEEELKQFAALFEIDKDISTKSKFFILKTIQKSLDERVNVEGEEIQKVTWFKERIAKIKSSAGNQDSQPSELDALKKEIEALQEKQQTEMNTLLSKLADVSTSTETTTPTHEINDLTETPTKPKECMKTEDLSNSAFLRREFKISGQIGEPGQADKLTFVSLTHQIDSGIKRGYKETEIVDAVIRAISLHSSLRSYVETLKDLSLPKLRKILRVHYREKSASELYQNLATIFQEPKETSQQFLLRSLDLRSKVGFASKESDCEVQYDEPLIQKTFMKSFETGLRDDILAANLRPILRLSGLTDEDLMRHVNELASHQAERQNKLACERRSAKINACEVDGAEIKDRKNGGENKILAEIREIKSDLASLKKQARDSLSGNREVSSEDRTSSKTSRRRGWGCSACKERRVGPSCQHCFSCGEFGHIASECAKNLKRSGNEYRQPRRRDRV